MLFSLQSLWMKILIWFTKHLKYLRFTCLDTSHAGVPTGKIHMIASRVYMHTIWEIFEGHLRSSSMWLKIAKTCRSTTPENMAGKNVQKVCCATSVIQRLNVCTTQTNTRESTVIVRGATRVRSVPSTTTSKSDHMPRKCARIIKRKWVETNTILISLLLTSRSMLIICNNKTCKIKLLNMTTTLRF